MLGLPITQLSALQPLAAAGGSALVIVVLCALAGVGTVMLLPARREAGWRKIGGAVVLLAGLIGMAALIRMAAVRTSGDLYFWVFSGVALAAALRVVTHPRPVYSALYFVLTVLASAGLFVLLWAQFMAAALVLIYAGAILITYVFVIMLAQQASGAKVDDVGGAECDNISREPAAAAAIGFALMAVLLIVIFDMGQGIAPRPHSPSLQSTRLAKGSVEELAAYLFRDQVLGLELAGVILALAMVGAVIIARRRVVTEEAPAAVSPVALGDDNPHNLPVTGTLNPRAKEYPEA